MLRCCPGLIGQEALSWAPHQEPPAHPPLPPGAHSQPEADGHGLGRYVLPGPSQPAAVRVVFLGWWWWWWRGVRKCVCAAAAAAGVVVGGWVGGTGGRATICPFRAKLDTQAHFPCLPEPNNCACCSRAHQAARPATLLPRPRASGCLPAHIPTGCPAHRYTNVRYVPDDQCKGVLPYMDLFGDTVMCAGAAECGGRCVWGVW